MSAAPATDTFSLPRAITRASQAPAARAAIQRAHSALVELETQLAVFKIEQLFNETPNLMAFSFCLEGQGDDEGGTSYYPIVSATGRSADGSDEQEDDENEELSDRVADRLYNIDDDILSVFEDTSFERPVDGSPLIDALMKAALDAEAFAAWLAQAQKEELEAAAGPATSARENANSV